MSVAGDRSTPGWPARRAGVAGSRRAAIAVRRNVNRRGGIVMYQGRASMRQHDLPARFPRSFTHFTASNYIGVIPEQISHG